jgi:isopenicillin N synthase-like dioxygenase
MNMSAAVPTIDISKPGIADGVARTCERTGFLIISGHGFPLGLLERAQRELFAFFDLPEATKNRWHPSGPSRQRGYHGFATRGLAYTLGQKTPPDLRESIFLGPVDDHRAYYAGMPEAATSYAPNLIPDEPAGLAATLVLLYREYERLARDMMRIFAAALRLPEGFFDGTLDRHFSIMSCHHYPVLEKPPLPGQLRTGAHTDYGAMTILAATEAQGGLEVRLPDGSWTGVRPRVGEFVVNL